MSLCWVSLWWESLCWVSWRPFCASTHRVLSFFSNHHPLWSYLKRGNTKGGVSLYRWPPVWLVWIGCMTTDKFCFYLQNRLIQTSPTGGHWYSDTFPSSLSCFKNNLQIIFTIITKFFIILQELTYLHSNLCLCAGSQAGNSYWRRRLSTADLLIKIGYFVKKENLVSVWKAADLN